jgi:hypothetical protein
MNWCAPVLVLSGLLQPPVPGCRDALAAADAARAASLAGWPKLADQRFSLRDVDGVPADRWSEARALGDWPSQRFERNGDFGPFCGVAFARTAARRVLIRRLAGAGAPVRLQLLAEVDLRRALAVRDGDRVHLAVHDPIAWRNLPPWGYHHMCG